MKKIFLVASLLCLITVGVNAQSSTGKTTKKTAAKTTVQKHATTSAAATDTTHHKSMAMVSKKHYKRHKAVAPKTK